MNQITVIHIFINLILIVHATDQNIYLFYSGWCEKQIQVKNTLLRFKNSYYPDINFVSLDSTREIQIEEQDRLQTLLNLEKSDNISSIENKLGGIPAIFFSDKQKLRKYENDLTNKDLAYFSQEFFTGELNYFNSEEDLHSFNRKFPNLIFFYGYPEQHSDQLKIFTEISSNFPIYYRFIVRPDKNQNFHKYFFIQKYDAKSLYIIIRRFHDNYDNILLTNNNLDDFKMNLDQFMQQYSQPIILKELTHKSLMHIKKFEKQLITFHLIGLEHVKFENYLESFKSSIVSYRQSREKLKVQPLFIQSDAKGLAKVLLYRFLKKSLKDTPIIVAYQFENEYFYYNVYDNEKNKYSLYNMKIWIEDQVKFGIVSNIYEETISSKSIILQQFQAPEQYLYFVQTFDCQTQLKFKALVQLLEKNHRIKVIDSKNIDFYQKQVKNNKEISRLISNTSGPQLFYICQNHPEFIFEITLKYDLNLLNEQMIISTKNCVAL